MFLAKCVVQIENLPYFYFRSISLSDLEHVSHVSLRSRIIASLNSVNLCVLTYNVLLLINYVTL